MLLVYVFIVSKFQALNTSETERQWVIDHLGHTMDVHRIHYRQTSDMLERADVAKILLIQDLGLVGKYRGKRLEDIQLDGNIFLYSYSNDALKKNVWHYYVACFSRMICRNHFVKHFPALL